MSNIKAMIFDCFGVLYPNSTAQFFKKHQNLFSNHEFLDQLNLQIDLGKITSTQFFTELEKETGIPADKIRTEIDQILIPDQELINLIKKLKTNYKIGLLSNAGQEEISIIYRDNLNTLFDSITVSHETGTVKPNPEIFLTSAQKLGVEPADCLFIDDTPINIEAAKKSGMQTIIYSDFNILKQELSNHQINIK